jgi:hypothetical protein
VILGQLQNGDGRGDKALVAFQKARAIGPSPRVNAFIANDDLLKGEYGKARASLESVEKSLPKGSVPFAVRFGITFSHIYEGNTDAALEVAGDLSGGVQRPTGLDQQFPRSSSGTRWPASTWSGRLDEALKDYEKGYQSVPGSSIPRTRSRPGWAGCTTARRARSRAWASTRRPGPRSRRCAR